jgi:hypothetical protein
VGGRNGMCGEIGGCTYELVGIRGLNTMIAVFAGSECECMRSSPHRANHHENRSTSPRNHCLGVFSIRRWECQKIKRSFEVRHPPNILDAVRHEQTTPSP